MPVVDVSEEIQNILETNKLGDLKEFIKKRSFLNSCNIFLIYLFHIIQSAGILTTTIAAGYDMKEIIWVGVGFNILASLINMFEKTNNTISQLLLKDIQAIKNGTFVDEGTIVDPATTKEDDTKKQPLLSTA
jgi:hypothetical protein